MRAVTIESHVQELARALTSAILQTIVATPIGDLTFAGPPRPVFDEDLADRCRLCGCTDDAACPGGCSWVEADLCSACVTEPAKKKRTHARTHAQAACRTGGGNDPRETPALAEKHPENPGDPMEETAPTDASRPEPARRRRVSPRRERGGVAP